MFCCGILFLDYLHPEKSAPSVQLRPSVRLDGVSYRNRILHGHWNLERFSAIIEEFSSRELTYEEDRFAAVEGLFSHITKTKGVLFFGGHPVVNFEQSLLWDAVATKGTPVTEGAERRRVGFPSWGWAGYPGSIKFPLKLLHKFYVDDKPILAARLGDGVEETYFLEPFMPAIQSFDLTKPLALRTWFCTLRAVC